MRNKSNPNIQSIKKLRVQPDKGKASLASDFLAVLKQLLIESESEEEGRCDKERHGDVGKNQPVGEYPDSPLRYKGGGVR